MSLFNILVSKKLTDRLWPTGNEPFSQLSLPSFSLTSRRRTGGSTTNDKPGKKPNTSSGKEGNSMMSLFPKILHSKSSDLPICFLPSKTDFIKSWVLDMGIGLGLMDIP
jgi:hypothetical protein